MTEDQAALRRFTGIARLFPLPNLVLFPHVMQGLHIFEPRYRQLTTDALADDSLITLVMLGKGWEQAGTGRPPIESVGCLGRVTEHERLPDGRFNLWLRGIGRVRLVAELPTDKLYRIARAELMPDVITENLPALLERRRELAAVVLPRFDPSGSAHRQLKGLFEGDLPLGALCDLLAYALPIPIELKQLLLEEPHVEARAELLLHALRPTAPLTTTRFPPEFSVN